MGKLLKFFWSTGCPKIFFYFGHPVLGWKNFFWDELENDKKSFWHCQNFNSGTWSPIIMFNFSYVESDKLTRKGSNFQQKITK